MKTRTSRAHALPQSTRDSVPSPEAIRQQLDRILTSPDFQNSRKSQLFLRFVVEETLAGRGEALKAYTIAVKA